LHKHLRQLRDEICEKNNLPIYIVANSATLDEMAMYLPQSPEELKKISGFGDAKIEKYGLQFLNIIQQYSHEHNLSSLIDEKPKTKKQKLSNAKPDTKQESFKLYKEGKNVAQIAEIRNLTTQTIEGHLAHYVSSG
jgi:ribonuclease D